MRMTTRIAAVRLLLAAALGAAAVGTIACDRSDTTPQSPPPKAPTPPPPAPTTPPRAQLPTPAVAGAFVTVT
jgi:hypothetical protein